MDREGPARDFEPSRMYAFVRGRQLEGTFPGDACTGVWPITVLRIGRGWGLPPEGVWPYNGDALAWPPAEPPNVDAAAKPNRGGRYQRVRTLSECKTVLGLLGFPVMVSLEITDKWGSAPAGRIPARSPSDVVVGSHTVLLYGYDDSRSEFKFRNSWGRRWGTQGDGYIDYDTFETTWVEGWLEDFPESWFKDWPGNKARSEDRRGVIERSWGVAEHGGGVFHCREFLDPDDERIAWAFAVERSGVMEVEEFFVWPQFRGVGYGTKLAHSIGELAVGRGCSLKIWISYPDAAPENLQILEKLVRPLGLRLGPSDVRWAPYVATTDVEVPPAEQHRSS
jgi:GNAT superfamily N-acetyltransferase